MDYRKLRGIHFIRVRGNSSERTRAHCELLKDHLLQGPLLPLSRKNEWMIRRGPGLVRFSPIQELVVQFYKKILLPLLDRKAHPEDREVLKAAAEVTGFPYSTCREILYQPEGLMLMARASLMRHLLPDWNIPGGLPGCTSGVALKEMTRNKKLLAGRNLDYFIVGSWEAHPTVVFNEPTGTDEIPYVSLTAAGIPSGGLTAINAEGMTIFTHAHFGKKVSFRGRPIAFLGDHLIRKARNLGEAIDFAKKNLPVTNWSFVISSGKENRAAVIEMTPDRALVREATDGFLGHTNYFHHSELQQDEALLCGSYCEDLKSRFCRVREVIQSHFGTLEPHHVSQVLGDQMDYLTRDERVLGNTVGVITTVQSAVFESENLRFWIATRNESPVGLGDYFEVNTENFWKQTSEDCEKKASVLPGYQPRKKTLIEALRLYREAYKSYQMENDHPQYQERALQWIDQAIQVYPEDGHLWVQAGLLSFKLSLPSVALRYFEESKPHSVSEHVSQVRALYIARCLDLLGKREDALQVYRSYTKAELGTCEPKLQKAFARGLKRAFRKSEMNRIVLDLQFPDTFTY